MALRARAVLLLYHRVAAPPGRRLLTAAQGGTLAIGAHTRHHLALNMPPLAEQRGVRRPARELFPPAGGDPAARRTAC